MFKCKVEKNGIIEDVHFEYFEDFEDYPLFNDLVYIDISTTPKSEEKFTEMPFELPPKLKTLKINHHKITSLPNFPEPLQFFSAINNKFDTIDWILQCPNMENVNLQGNDCEYIICPGVPKELRELNLGYCKIKGIHIDDIPGEYLRIDLDHNFLLDVPDFIADNPNISASFSYNDFHKSDQRTIEARRIANKRRIKMIKRDLPYTNSQNVHHTDINQSIVLSIDKLINYVDKYNFDYDRYIQDLNDYNEKNPNNPKIDEFSYLKRYKHKPMPKDYDHMKKIKKECGWWFFGGGMSDVFGQLEHDDQLQSTFGPNLITYRDLLRVVWYIVDNSIDRKQLLKVFEAQIKDGIGICFVGRISRLLNVLAGFIDCIQISVSEKQELNGRAIALIKEMKKTISEESDEFVIEYKKKMEKLLEEYPEIPEDDRLIWLEAYD